MKIKKALQTLIIFTLILLIGCTTSTTPIQKTEQIQPVVEKTAVADTPVEKVEKTEIIVEEFDTIVSISKYGNCQTGLDYFALEKEGIMIGDIYTITINDYSFDAPVVTNYSDVDLGKHLIKASETGIEFAINMGNLAKKANINVGDKFTYTLKEKGGYADEYMIRHLTKSMDRADYASDEIFANFRSVGTGSIKEGRLYRSANPVLDDERAPYAAKLMEAAKIQYVINLADSKETAEKNLESAPYYKELYEKGQVITLDMGVDFYSEDFAQKLKAGFTFLTEAKTPVLIHCNEGKDRAGVVTALLEALTGATMDEIVEDYMISFENYFGVEKGSEKYEKISNVIRDFFKTINNGKEVGNKQALAVSVDYLKNTLGMSVNDIATIRLLLR